MAHVDVDADTSVLSSIEKDVILCGETKGEEEKKGTSAESLWRDYKVVLVEGNENLNASFSVDSFSSL